MSVLFSRLITNEAAVREPAIESGWSIDYDATMFVDEHYNDTNDEFNGYLLEGVRLAFLANECESVEMIAESLSEVIDGIVEWFKKWLKKFKEFAMKILRKIYDFFVKGEESIKTFEKEYRNFEEFSVKGYEYTIISNDNNMKILGEFMNTINGAILEIAHSTPNTIDAKLSTLKDNLCSSKAMDVVRGAILNVPPVDHSNFKKELKAAFRNGANDKTNIIVNPSTAVAMCKKFHMFKSAIEHCRAMKNEMEKMCELTIAWIEGEPDFMYSSLPKGGSYDFRRKQLNAIHQLYQTANLTAKNIQYAYDIYYAAKLDALHEAIQFYLKTIKTAYLKSKAGAK